MTRQIRIRVVGGAGGKQVLGCGGELVERLGNQGSGRGISGGVGGNSGREGSREEWWEKSVGQLGGRKWVVASIGKGGSIEGMGASVRREVGV